MEDADRAGARAFQAMVPMRDGTRLNTFVFLPESGGPHWPVILHRTPYGITASDARDKTDCNRAWLPSAEEPFRGSILRGWCKLIEFAPDGYAMLFMDGVTRAMYRDPSGEPRPLVPGRVERLTVDLGHIHHTYQLNHRLEVDVTSSNFPRRARNANGGHLVLANDSDADIRGATNTVHHADETPSFVELPMLTRQ